MCGSLQLQQDLVRGEGPNPPRPPSSGDDPADGVGSRSGAVCDRVAQAIWFKMRSGSGNPGGAERTTP